MYLLTNQTGDLPMRLKKKYRIAHHFNHVFNSAEIGISKPDLGVFRHFLKNIKAKASECLFIDDKKENIETAKKLGFKTILFKNNRQFLTQVRKLKKFDTRKF